MNNSAETEEGQIRGSAWLYYGIEVLE